MTSGRYWDAWWQWDGFPSATAEEIKGLEETVVWTDKPLGKRIRKELEAQGHWLPKK